jgi:ParB family chromosome partitioning protein
LESREISIDLIDEPSFDVRSWISREELEELAGSIQAVGILQDIRVFEKDGRYEIEDGHRRFLAAKMIGLQFVPCKIVTDQAGKREIHKLHANLHSEKLSPIEQARTLLALREQFQYTPDELAKLMGRSYSRIMQLLGLLNFDECLVQAMEGKIISESAARLLMQIPDPERRPYYIEYIRNGGASIDMIRSWVAQEQVWANTPSAPPELTLDKAPDVTITYPTQRCVCCRRQERSDKLFMFKVCPDCFDTVNQVLPSIYAAMQKEGEEEKPVEPIKEEEWGGI